MQTMFTNKCTKPNDGAKNQTKESELRCSFHGNASDAEHSIYVVMYENKSKSRTNGIVHIGIEQTKENDRAKERKSERASEKSERDGKRAKEQ